VRFAPVPPKHNFPLGGGGRSSALCFRRASIRQSDRGSPATLPRPRSPAPFRKTSTARVFWRRPAIVLPFGSQPVNKAPIFDPSAPSSLGSRIEFSSRRDDSVFIVNRWRPGFRHIQHAPSSMNAIGKYRSKTALRLGSRSARNSATRNARRTSRNPERKKSLNYKKFPREGSWALR